MYLKYFPDSKIILPKYSTIILRIWGPMSDFLLSLVRGLPEVISHQWSREMEDPSSRDPSCV